MKLTEKQIIARIRAHGRGFVFSTKLFSALTDDSASVRTALSRLVQKQSIRRLAHGLYDFLFSDDRAYQFSPFMAVSLSETKL